MESTNINTWVEKANKLSVDKAATMVQTFDSCVDSELNTVKLI